MQEFENEINNQNENNNIKPDFNAPLTEAEINSLREEYINNMNLINNALPEEKRLPVDLEGFNKKVNDPINQRKFRISSEIAKNNVIKERKLQELKEKFGDFPTNKHPLNRNFYEFLKADDSVESQQYNEKLYQEYLKEPNAVAQHFVQKLINFDFSKWDKMHNNPDFESYAVEFEYEHQDLSSIGFNISFMTDNNSLSFNEDFAQAEKSFKGMFESLKEGGEVARNPRDFFTLPNLTDEYLSELATKDFGDDGEFGRKLIQKFQFDSSKEHSFGETANFFKKAKEKGFDTSEPNFIIRYGAKVVENGKERNVSFVDAILGKAECKNAIIYRFPEKTFQNIKQVTKTDYSNKPDINIPKEPSNITRENQFDEFNKRIISNYALDKKMTVLERDRLTHKDVLEGNKGGIFERLFRTTSRQYNEFKKAYNEFNDSKSENYKNYQNLKEKAKAYLDYKKVENERGALKLDSTGKGRCLFALSVLEAQKETSLNSIEKNIIKDGEIVDNRIDDPEFTNKLAKDTDLENDNIIDTNTNEMDKNLELDESIDDLNKN